jgi:tripartite-type tricarboxylate transporter receptor subunit TctC
MSVIRKGHGAVTGRDKKLWEAIMKFSRRSVLTAVAAASALLLAGPAGAQGFPEREIKIICGFAPGSGADIVVRYFAEKVRPLTGHAVIVENKVGALTAIGAEALKNAKPDGYTVMITPGNSTMAANPHLFKELKYDPVKDFTPITTLLKLPFIVGVTPTSPIKSVKELSEDLKKKGDKASYGYSSPFALASSELYMSIIGGKALGVSYKSTPDIMPDLASGQLDFIFSDSTFLIEQSKQNRFRMLAVTYAKRSALLPDVPGMEDAGVPNFDMSAWWGVWGPAGMPKPIVDKMAGWFDQIVNAPNAKEEFASKFSADPWPGNAKLLADTTPVEIKKWGELIKLAKIEPQ